MDKNTIKLMALNTSEEILQRVLSSAKGKATKQAKKSLESTLYGFDVLPDKLREDMITDEIEKDIDFYRGFIEDLIPEFNAQILKRIEDVERMKNEQAKLITSYDEKLSEKDRIIDNMKRK